MAIVDTSSEPKSILNPDLEPLSVLSEKYKCRVFGSVEELLEDTEIARNLDGVMVATPHATHFETTTGPFNGDSDNLIPNWFLSINDDLGKKMFHDKLINSYIQN